MEWAAVSGILGVFVGLFLGNRLALGRDKRKEFNDATVDVRYKLSFYLKNLKEGRSGGYIRPADINQVIALIGAKRCNKIIEAHEYYAEVLSESYKISDEGLQVFVSDKAAERLIEAAQLLYDRVQPV